MMARRPRSGSCASSAAATSSKWRAPRPIRTACASSSCSACASRSLASQCGLTLPSLTITISDGPASRSMPTAPYSCRLASVTQALPGPAILSTFGTVSVP